jgi:signal transduction histidine kinase
LSNAIRLAPHDSTVTTAVGSRDGWAWIAVRDQGPGIPEDEREHVFDRFYRGNRGRTGDNGTGLGLSIARQIIESHGGQLVVFSTVGLGSTFVIWLPDRAIARDARDAKPPSTDPLGEHAA